MGVTSGYAVAYGGVPVGAYGTGASGTRQLVNPDAQLTQGGEWPESEQLELDLKFCQEIKDDETQCGARPVRDEKYCIGHLRKHEKQLTTQE